MAFKLVYRSVALYIFPNFRFLASSFASHSRAEIRKQIKGSRFERFLERSEFHQQEKWSLCHLSRLQSIHQAFVSQKSISDRLPNPASINRCLFSFRSIFLPISFALQITSPLKTNPVLPLAQTLLPLAPFPTAQQLAGSLVT